MFSVVNPATEDVIAEVPRTPVEQVDETIAHHAPAVAGAAEVLLLRGREARLHQRDARAGVGACELDQFGARLFHPPA